MFSRMNLKRFYRINAYILLLAMLFCVVALPPRKAYAFDASKYKVDSVTVFKVYDENRNLVQRKILIMGEYLMGAKVGIITSSGFQQLSNRTVDTEGLLQFDLGQDQLGNSISIENKIISLNEGEMPTLTGINRRVEVGQNLQLQGTNLMKVQDAQITAGFEHEGAYTGFADESVFNNNTAVTISNMSGTLGYQNIIFEKRDVLTGINFNTVNSSVDVTVDIKHTYKDQFRLVQNLDIQDLVMHPNRGEAGDRVYFEAPAATLDSYDVFFLTKVDGTDVYTSAKKGINKTFQQNIGGKDILSVQVPSLSVGEYYVVLTNAVSDGSDPMKTIVREMFVKSGSDYDKFTVINSTVKSKIISLQPQIGPDTGSKTIISGQFLVSMNIPEYVPGGSEVEIEKPSLDLNTQELVVRYSPDNPGKYNNWDITSAVRKVKIIIGDTAAFLKKPAPEDAYDVIYNRDLDTIAVTTPQVTDADTKPVKDVVAETETTFTRTDGSTIIIKERAELDKGYTYIPSKVAPTINSVNPGKIQVIPADGGLALPEDRYIAILGDNFMVNKYVGPDNNEIVRYPIVELGPEIGLNKNTVRNNGDPASDPGLEMKVFNAAGKEVDGTEGNELGTKILIKLTTDKIVSTTGKTYIKVSNPVRNSTSTGLSAIIPDFIEFVSPDTNRNPVITAVTPSVSTIEGGEQIAVDGSNFTTGVKVYMDGEEITSVTRQGDGKRLTFACPKGREGETQLQVINPEGGMDTWPFMFVKTYTNPRITDFSPKSGNTGTLVIVSGDNFLKPEPTATEDNIYKLIGSRVLLEGAEINDYNVNSITKKIELVPYTSPENDVLLRIENAEGSGKKLSIAGYYSSILLKDTVSGHFYTLDVDARGRIILTDGAGSNYTLELNADGSAIQADKEGGGVVGVTATRTGITLATSPAITLSIRTLYKVERIGDYDYITGNRMKVLDRNHIYFKVPILEADGYYDVSVINPDTKKDTKADAQGFYYYGQPQSRPTIASIQPGEGSVGGGYSVVIKGTEFEDNGTSKSKVFVNGKEVAGSDIQVGTDGKTIVIKIPPYPGDLLQDRGTSRLSVPVVVVNPDGGSVSMVNGFTYVVPGSHPQISKVVPQKGAASGGDVVEITGTDFRYFEPFDDSNRNQTRDAGESFNNINGNTDGSGFPIWDSESALMTDPVISGRTELEGNSRYSYYYSSPILPRVYFGSSQARIVEFSRGYLKVIVPEGTAGSADLFVVNNDSGISNIMKFTYEASNPGIDRILPNQGRKQGGDRLEIIGSGFQNTTIKEYTGTVVGNVNQTEEKIMPMVRFGNMSNRNIPREEPNSGRVDSGIASVALAGGLSVQYNSINNTLDLGLDYNGNYYYTINGYDDSIRYIPLSLLRDSTGQTSGAYELIRVEISDRRLIVERGYSPASRLISPNQLALDTPSYYTVEKVAVVVKNPDGGEATGNFEYRNPSSNPEIISISKEGQSPSEETINGKVTRVIRVSSKGGSILGITGEDFRENATVQISSLANLDKGSLSYDLPNRLSFEMPAVPDSAVGSLNRLVVLNADGGSAFSDELSPPIYIIFTKGDTSPAIEGLTPEKGPSSGGVKVKITGSDFRERMDGFSRKLAVYFGETKVPDSDVTVADNGTIYAVAPPGKPGQVKVRVENPDGVVTNPGGSFDYISNPVIRTVVDAMDSAESSRLSTISVKGGQNIKLKGSGFAEGARVLFNPSLEQAPEGAQGGEVIYISGTAYVLESGNEGTDTALVDSETLTVITPQGKIGTSGIILVNPDGGATEIYSGIVYGLPGTAAPTGVHAELIYDRYIKVNWNAVDGAREYEIYVVIDDNETELAGSTRLNSFVYTDLEPKTGYRFVIRSVGEFGQSQPSEESNKVRTGSRAGPPDEDGGISDRTKFEKSGDMAAVSIGEKDYDKAETVIDLTKGYLAGSRTVVVSIPASVAASQDAEDITVIGRDFRIRFNPSAFRTKSLKDKADSGDSGVRLSIAPTAADTSVSSSRDYMAPLSGKYALEAKMYTGRDFSSMNYLNTPIEITMNFDSNLAEQRKLENVALSRYDGPSAGWVSIASPSGKGSVVKALTDRLGIYMVTGRRH